MNRALHTIFVVAMTMVPMALSAQMTIEDFDENKEKRVSFVDTLQKQDFTVGYFSPALYRHQRKLVKEERNSVEISVNLQGSLTSLNDPWIETSGGDNSVTLLSTVTFKHTFKKNKFSVETNFTSKFGYYRVMLDGTDDAGDTTRDPVWYKNQDEFTLTVTPSYEMSKNWSYGTPFSFRSQYSKGYVSSSSQESYHIKSDFLSPAYLDVSGGFIYKSPNEKLPFTISLSPVAMSATYVHSREVMLNAGYSYKEHTTDEPTSYVEAYGVSPTSTSNYEGGSSVNVSFTRSFGKTSFLKYTTNVYSFYGWMTQIAAQNVYGNVDAYNAALEVWNDDQVGSIKPMLSLHPTVRWENTIEIKAAKLLTTSIYFQLYYNRAQSVKIQTKTLLSVGLGYTFNSK